MKHDKRNSKGRFTKKESEVQLHGQLAQQAKDEKWMPIREWELAGAKGESPFDYTSVNNCAFCQHYKKCVWAFDVGCPLYRCADLVDACRKSHNSTPMLAVLDGFIEAARKEREPAPEPFEAMVYNNRALEDSTHRCYGLFKLIEVSEMGTLYKAGDGQYHDMGGGYLVDRFDFATPAERERFENVKREVERKGQRYEGNVTFTIPEGKIVVYAGEFRQPAQDELYNWEMSAVYAHIVPNELRTILALIDDPDVKKKPEPMNMTIAGQKVKMYANPHRCADCAHPFAPKPKPQFEVGQVVCNKSTGELFRISKYNTGWLYDKNGSCHAEGACRPARLSDFRKTSNGVEVLMQYASTGNVNFWINRHGNFIMHKDGELLATALGCVVAPADITEE